MADTASAAVVIAVTAVVVVSVLTLFVWAAIQDGRENDAAARRWRRQRKP